MASRPNVLLICTDQHRFDAISAHPGSPAITPNLAALADDGIVFDHCYTPSPMCAPTRASLLTGELPSSHGLWANGVTLPEGRSMVSKELADAGYRTGLVGKLHLSAAFQGATEERVDDGFDVFRWAHDPFHGSRDNAYHSWLREKHPAQWEAAQADVVTPDLTGFKHVNTRFDEMPTEAHYSTWVTEEVNEFLTDDDERPFFLVANFFDPHHPFAAPKEYLDMYPPGSVPPPAGGREELASKPARQTDASDSSYVGHGPSFVDYTPEEIDEIRRTYYASITLIDDCIGRIMATLSERDDARDTLVIFTSDHGEMLGDHALLLKGPMLYDGAVRVPMIVAASGLGPAGARVDGFVGSHDVATTIRRAAGLAPVSRDQGRDLLAVARGEEEARPYAWCEYRNSGYEYDPPANTTMLRRHDYKIIVWHGDPDENRAATGELYDMAADPHELSNLWADPAYQDIRLELYEQLCDLQMNHEDRHAPRVAPW